MLSKLLVLTLILGFSICPFAQTTSPANLRNALPTGYWPLEKSQPIIDKTQTIRLAPDLSQLSEGERKALGKLLAAGKIFQSLYEQQRHAQALSAYSDLLRVDKRTGSKAPTQNLLTLYRLNQGPIATTLDNKREPFLPVEPTQPGKNVYPWGAKKEEIGAFLSAHPAKREEILDLRTVVRQATVANLERDLQLLRRYPVLDTLNPDLRRELEAQKSPRRYGGHGDGFYAVPYAVAYADELMKVYGLLHEAVAAVRQDDEEFARYLRNRARDLLSNDYESGDAAWVTGHFRSLNVLIGSYETYDDELYGVKTLLCFQSLEHASAGNDGTAPGNEGFAGAGRFASLRPPQEGA
jgi:hypothetical protein